MPSGKHASNPSPAGVNVLFHGLFVFKFCRDEYVRVHVPVVKGHSYKAGPYKAETDLRQGKHYRLHGVRGKHSEPGEFQPRDYAVSPAMHFMNPADDCIFCDFHLPMPHEILSLRFREKLNKEDFFPGARLVWPPQRLASILVFTYEKVTGQDLCLEPGAICLPSPSRNNAGQAFNFHVFSEPPTPQDVEHVLHATEVFNDLFPGLDIHFNRAYKDNEIESPQESNIPGIRPEDQLGLGERDQEKARGGNCHFLAMIGA